METPTEISSSPRTIMSQCRKHQRRSLSLAMKQEICLYRLNHPKASLKEIAAIFNVKWSMPLTNYTIRYIVRASDKWLGTGESPDIKNRSDENMVVTDEQLMVETEMEHSAITVQEKDPSFEPSVTYISSDITADMKREICLHRMNCPKASLKEIAAYFSKKWSIILTNYNIRYIVRQSARWLSLDDQYTKLRNVEDKNAEESSSQCQNTQSLKTQLTEEMSREICLYRAGHPNATLQDIAVHFNIKWSFPLTTYNIKCIVRSSDKLLSFNTQEKQSEFDQMTHEDSQEMKLNCDFHSAPKEIFDRDLTKSQRETVCLDVDSRKHNSSDNDSENAFGNDLPTSNDFGINEDHDGYVCHNEVTVANKNTLVEPKLCVKSDLDVEQHILTGGMPESVIGNKTPLVCGVSLDDARHGLMNTLSYITEHSLFMEHANTLWSVFNGLTHISEENVSVEKFLGISTVKQENRIESGEALMMLEDPHKGAIVDASQVVESGMSDDGESISTLDDIGPIVDDTDKVPSPAMSTRQRTHSMASARAALHGLSKSMRNKRQTTKTQKSGKATNKQMKLVLKTVPSTRSKPQIAASKQRVQSLRDKAHLSPLVTEKRAQTSLAWRASGHQHGLFTTATLSRGLMFGPYDGPATNPWEGEYWTDPPPETMDWSTMQWMGYVRCLGVKANKHCEDHTDEDPAADQAIPHNVEVVRIRGQVYYMTICDVPVDTELVLDASSQYKEKKHKEQTVYQCTTCNKQFRYPWALKYHGRTHTGEKPHACNLCGRAFARPANLRVHIRSHTQYRPFLCSDCGKTFLQRADLRKHIRTHTGEKPYACDYCGQKYSQNCQVVRHRRTHTGERPFPCVFCDRCFSDTSTLRKHKKRCQLKHQRQNETQDMKPAQDIVN